MKTIGVIGGSGLYEMAELRDIEHVQMATPFGHPSDDFICGTLDGVRYVFLPRHGRGHRILPSEVNHRANIFGMKKLGAEWLISVGAVGSLRAEIAPGHLVVPDQFIDRTARRPSTFFGRGIVAHVGFADPVCAPLTAAMAAAAREAGASVHEGGTYVCMEGPQFSTRAESELHRSWGGTVIGMTTVQEAKLAREAEICFANLALVTDYDCWNTGVGDVAIDEVLRILSENVGLAKRLIGKTGAALSSARHCPCASALENAIITDPERIPRDLKRDLAPLIRKYIGD